MFEPPVVDFSRLPPPKMLHQRLRAPDREDGFQPVDRLAQTRDPVLYDYSRRGGEP